MERLFYKKKISVLIVALAIVVVLLLCILLTALVQLTSLKQTIKDLNELLQKAEENEAAAEALKNYKNTDKYVIEWAVSMGYIPENVYNYIPKN